jgi:hypothetical protein
MRMPGKGREKPLGFGGIERCGQGRSRGGRRLAHEQRARRCSRSTDCLNAVETSG